MPRSALSHANNWETDPRLFQILQATRLYMIDGAADPSNALLLRWWGPGSPEREDALSPEPWPSEGRLWFNPPYNRLQGAFVYRAAWEAWFSGAKADLLVPAYTDTAWWQANVPYAREVRYLRGRLSFFLGGVKYTTARFPSALLCFDGRVGEDFQECRHRLWDWKEGRSLIQ